MEEQKTQRIFRMQPILCPWITSQPYHSSLWNRNRAASHTDSPLNNPWIHRQMTSCMSKAQDKPVPSIQQSSSQFFYFLRLMQLFPDTHPATLHTVLTLCKNDFFCAVDKMLYAKRCKLLCFKKNLVQRNQQGRNKGFGQGTDGQKASLQKTNSKRDDTAVDINLQDLSNTLGINSVSEKAEDLTTIKKYASPNSTPNT